MNTRDSLFMAISSNHPQAVARLAKSADLTAKNDKGCTAIHVAAHQERWQFVISIAEAQKTNEEDKADYGSALLYAVWKNKMDSARILLGAGASPDRTWDEKQDTNLHIAVRNRNIPMLKLLISFNADLTRQNEDKQTPIQLAANLKYWDCVIAIAQNKRTNNTDAALYKSALLCAVWHNELSAARTLLQAGTPTSSWSTKKNCDSNLHCAVRNNNHQMIALLLEFGANVSRKNKAKLTPEKLGQSLNTNCFSAGWTKYYNQEVLKTQAVLMVFTQAARLNHPLFSRIPYPVLELVLPFLSREISRKTDKIELTKTRFNTYRQECEVKKETTITSAADKFVKKYGSTPPASEASKKFMERLKSKDSRTIYSAVTLFVAENKGKKTKTLTKLLASDLYKLMR